MAEAQDRGTNSTPAYTMTVVSYLPTGLRIAAHVPSPASYRSTRVLPVCAPILMPHRGVFPKGGEGGSKSCREGGFRLPHAHARGDAVAVGTANGGHCHSTTSWRLWAKAP